MIRPYIRIIFELLDFYSRSLNLLIEYIFVFKCLSYYLVKLLLCCWVYHICIVNNLSCFFIFVFLHAKSNFCFFFSLFVHRVSLLWYKMYAFFIKRWECATIRVIKMINCVQSNKPALDFNMLSISYCM